MIKSCTQRIDDKKSFKFDISLNKKTKHDKVIISFVHNSSNLEILSTSVGQISNNQIELMNGLGLVVHTEYIDNISSLECLMGYFKNKSLIFSDSEVCFIQNGKQIQELVIDSKIPYSGKKYIDKMSSFQNNLKLFKSRWKIELSKKDDILATFLSQGTNRILASFGEESEEVLSSDYLFYIDPGSPNFNIPQEIIKKQYDKYSLRPKLGIFQLVKPDFINFDNCFFKAPISNKMFLSEIK